MIAIASPRRFSRELGILALAIAPLGFAGGCGDRPTPPPPKAGAAAFSYDDDEIDPANLKTVKKQAKTQTRP